jgi:hypothetical protein
MLQVSSDLSVSTKCTTTPWPASHALLGLQGDSWQNIDLQGGFWKADSEQNMAGCRTAQSESTIRWIEGLLWVWRNPGIPIATPTLGARAQQQASTSAGPSMQVRSTPLVKTIVTWSSYHLLHEFSPPLQQGYLRVAVSCSL